MVKTFIVTASTIIGGFVGWYLGGFDGFLYALIAFVIADYITGVLAAIHARELSSAVGFRGIAKKLLIFVLVGLATLLDVYILGHAGVLRMATIFFYISNEGISLIENAVRLGLPIPKPFERALTSIRDTADGKPKPETPGETSADMPPEQTEQALFEINPDPPGQGQARW